ncbi:hypothetical protein N7474_009407 [Penicillium riverlandense]|uniref:uncharacterized protein n=1 Tax=Penicillium riverlandense TaxID=1903569 RepID=UPI00254666A5|nr:uncharacterized protein N7474_009407 [Penicillium riverlandense]KAJ5808138.1 hypothetical protein N7474_009407 [Penicillium riverlandense]
MPHKVTNDSNSSLASKGSGDSTDSNDQVIVTEVPGTSIIVQCKGHTTPAYPAYHRGSPGFGSKLTTPLPTVPAAKSNTSRRRRQPPVIVHNKGGQIYDETRPSDWDKQRWK